MTRKNVRIARKLVRIAKELAGGLLQDGSHPWGDNEFNGFLRWFTRNVLYELRDRENGCFHSMEFLESGMDSKTLFIVFSVPTGAMDVPEKIRSAVEYDVLSANIFLDEAEDVDDLVDDYDSTAKSGRLDSMVNEELAKTKRVRFDFDLSGFPGEIGMAIVEYYEYQQQNGRLVKVDAQSHSATCKLDGIADASEVIDWIEDEVSKSGIRMR